MGLNFSGRYYTEGGMLVAVHDAENAMYKGHEVSKDGVGLLELVWDKHGNCVATRPNVGVGLGVYNLARVANPQSTEAQVAILGCKECERWQKRRVRTNGE